MQSLVASQIEPSTGRVVVIGGSAGSIAALKLVVAALPADFPAAVLIVIHLAAHRPSALDAILRRAGSLPCEFARDGQEILPGRLYLAPPERHLVVQDQVTRLVYGPRHNLSRPAIDPLFRSAAQVFGPHAVGVVLSGMLDDGTQGLIAIKRQGGITVVQDPGDALHPDMPESALRYADVDYVLPAAEIGALLAEQVRQRAPESVGVSELKLGNHPIREAGKERRIEQREAAKLIEPDGDPFVLTCPECGGPLSELREKDLLHYECAVGHAYSLETLNELQHDGIERALWTALRSLRELISLRRRMIDHMELRNWDFGRKARLQSEIEEAERDAAVIQRLLKADQSERLPA
jgi:two-component system, chemotaxis family, protein-glutamate methylesterase/glutaminase